MLLNLSCALRPPSSSATRVSHGVTGLQNPRQISSFHGVVRVRPWSPTLLCYPLFHNPKNIHQRKDVDLRVDALSRFVV